MRNSTSPESKPISPTGKHSTPMEIEKYQAIVLDPPSPVTTSSTLNPLKGQMSPFPSTTSTSKSNQASSKQIVRTYFYHLVYVGQHDYNPSSTLALAPSSGHTGDHHAHNLANPRRDSRPSTKGKLTCQSGPVQNSRTGSKGPFLV